MTASLAYRTHAAAILAGDPPPKYTRLLPFIMGERIIELGSAEGVLACLLAKAGKRVTAIEASAERHASAKKLAAQWGVSGITFVNGKMQDNLSRLDGQDTFVGVRSIYYLRAEIDAVFTEIAGRVPQVVLCGNKGRAKAYHAGHPHEPLGEFNYYASVEGMRDLLTRHGYRIAEEVAEGDAIVVGRRD
jgi:hypothetical protein